MRWQNSVDASQGCHALNLKVTNLIQRP